MSASLFRAALIVAVLIVVGVLLGARHAGKPETRISDSRVLALVAGAFHRCISSHPLQKASCPQRARAHDVQVRWTLAGDPTADAWVTYRSPNGFTVYGRYVMLESYTGRLTHRHAQWILVSTYAASLSYRHRQLRVITINGDAFAFSRLRPSRAADRRVAKAWSHGVNECFVQGPSTCSQSTATFLGVLGSFIRTEWASLYDMASGLVIAARPQLRPSRASDKALSQTLVHLVTGCSRQRTSSCPRLNRKALSRLAANIRSHSVLLYDPWSRLFTVWAPYVRANSRQGIEAREGWDGKRAVLLTVRSRVPRPRLVSWTDILVRPAGLLVYLLPAILSLRRRVRHRGDVVVIDLLLGWTIIGWVWALYLALIRPSIRPPRSFAGTTPPLTRWRFRRRFGFRIKDIPTLLSSDVDLPDNLLQRLVLGMNAWLGREANELQQERTPGDLWPCQLRSVEIDGEVHLRLYLTGGGLQAMSNRCQAQMILNGEVDDGTLSCSTLTPWGTRGDATLLWPSPGIEDEVIGLRVAQEWGQRFSLYRALGIDFVSQARLAPIAGELPRPEDAVPALVDAEPRDSDARERVPQQLPSPQLGRLFTPVLVNLRDSLGGMNFAREYGFRPRDVADILRLDDLSDVDSTLLEKWRQGIVSLVKSGKVDFVNQYEHGLLKLRFRLDTNALHELAILHGVELDLIPKNSDVGAFVYASAIHPPTTFRDAVACRPAPTHDQVAPASREAAREAIEQALYGVLGIPTHPAASDDEPLAVVA